VDDYADMAADLSRGLLFPFRLACMGRFAGTESGQLERSAFITRSRIMKIRSDILKTYLSIHT
jgi:hypothetical protein